MRNVVLPNGMQIAEINAYETRFLYDEIFVQNVYASYGIEVRPADVLFDVGANIGLFALYMAERFNPQQILCFEPSPHCCEAARLNLATLGRQAVVLQTALGDTVGETTLTYYPGYTLMSSMFADETRDLDVLTTGAKTGYERHSGAPPAGRRAEMLETSVKRKLEGAQSIRCPITTLSKVMQDHRIDRLALAKIDVECAENVVLSGIAETDWPRIDQLVIEVHDQGAREHETMRDMLIGRGYAVSLFAEPELKNSGIYVVVARR